MRRFPHAAVVALGFALVLVQGAAGQTAAAPATAPIPAPPAKPSGPPGAGPDRLDFDLKFQDGSGATGSAGLLEYTREDYAALSGGVVLRYQDVEVMADTTEIDLATKQVIAIGNVVLDQSQRRLSGDSLRFDLTTKTGTMTNATAQIAPDYYFTGTEIAKTGDDTYHFENGVFTSCTATVPAWSFKVREADVQVEGYARVHGASMRAKKLPIFYTPYILWPVKTERTSGFLVPNLGYSQRRGSLLGLAYYQTLGRSWDTTFHLDAYSKDYLGVGDELRWRTSEDTTGQFIGYAIRDPQEDEWRWKVELNHAMNRLPFGMRAVVSYQDFSDFDFFRDFERDFDRNSFRFQDSRAFLTGNWGPHLLNVLVNDRQTFIGQGQFVNQRKLPEVEYRLRSTRLGKLPLYLQVQSSADLLDVERPQSYSGSYGRADVFPQLTLPIRAFPWLSLSITGGQRFTWYGDSIDPVTQTFTGKSESRSLPSASAQIVGPSFSKIWNGKIGDYTKFKHVIEPRFTYTYLGDYDRATRIPLFDEIDTVFSSDRGRYALVNRVLGKTSDEPNAEGDAAENPNGKSAGGGAAREILYFELAQEVSFDNNQPLQLSRDGLLRKSEGPVEALLRITPGAGLTAKLQLDYSTLFSRLQSRSLSAGYDWKGGNGIDLTWFTRYLADNGETIGDSIRFNTGLWALPKKLRLDAQLNYDVATQELQQQRYAATWSSQCWGLRFELRDFNAANQRNRDYRLSVSLKNVGTFLDLTGRSGDNSDSF